MCCGGACSACTAGRLAALSQPADECVCGLWPPQHAELPTYEAQNSHLKGQDAELVVQVLAELLHV